MKLFSFSKFKGFSRCFRLEAIENYSYSCFNPLSNERKSMFKSGDILQISLEIFKWRYLQKALRTRLICGCFNSRKRLLISGKLVAGAWVRLDHRSPTYHAPDKNWPIYKVYSSLRSKIFKFWNCYYLNKNKPINKSTSLSIYLFMLCLCSRPSPCHYVNVYMM